MEEGLLRGCPQVKAILTGGIAGFSQRIVRRFFRWGGSTPGEPTGAASHPSAGLGLLDHPEGFGLKNSDERPGRHYSGETRLTRYW